ncbi:Eukaryotic peptide chain release factor GTP-binding subunit [Dimargaris xerosporica]|nr:Eukaryotic peptide chain release factor GTP-binding subunit [Dimargaris xerosporica]
MEPLLDVQRPNTSPRVSSGEMSISQALASDAASPTPATAERPSSSSYPSELLGQPASRAVPASDAHPAATAVSSPAQPAVPPTQRIYQVATDRKLLFLCRGRLVTGRVLGPFLAALVLLITPIALFCVFECSFLWHEVHPAVVIVFGYVSLLALCNMLRASFTDPGILPRNLHANPYAYAVVGEPTLVPTAQGQLANQDPLFAYPPSTKQIQIHGIPVRLKFCDTCCIYRPPRASHCRQCNVCVENEDHHCAWLNNCVGRRNYRYFFLFVASATGLCAYVFSCSLWHLLKPLVQDQRSDTGAYVTFGQSITRTPLSLVLVIYSFIFFWSLGSLTAYHGYLISRNLTTHEQIKTTYSRRRRRYTSPFGHGSSWLFNCFYVVCRPDPEPPIHWRDKVPSASPLSAAPTEPDASRHEEMAAQRQLTKPLLPTHHPVSPGSAQSLTSPTLDLSSSVTGAALEASPAELGVSHLTLASHPHSLNTTTTVTAASGSAEWSAYWPTSQSEHMGGHTPTPVASSSQPLNVALPTLPRLSAILPYSFKLDIPTDSPQPSPRLSVATFTTTMSNSQKQASGVLNETSKKISIPPQTLVTSITMPKCSHV